MANPRVSESTLTDAQKETGRHRVLFLTPPALDDALQNMNPLIAFGASADQPGPFKRVFAEKGGTPMYARVGIPDEARYVFVAATETDKLYRFNIGESRHAKLNPNPQAGRRKIDLDLVFNLKTQSLEDYGRPKKLTQAEQAAAWKTCEPKADGVAVSVKGQERTLLNAEAVETLRPRLNTDQISGSWNQAK